MGHVLRSLKLLLLGAVLTSKAVAMPLITVVGAEENCGTFSGTRPAIATDSLAQPHIVIDQGTSNILYIYHKISGLWSQALFAQGSNGGTYDASRLYIPHIEIDGQDRAWISCKFGTKEYGTMLGGGVWCLNNVSTAPSERFFRYILVHKGYQMVCLDPFEPNRGVVLGSTGLWAKLDDSGATVATGNMNSGDSGEKIRFDIAPVNNGASRGVWHSAMGGYSAMSSAYQNILRYEHGLGPVTWASYATYPEQGSDFWHPGIGRDRVNPYMAYISVRYNPGALINIWSGNSDGSGQMVYPAGNLPVIDASASSVERFPPQWAPAPGAEGGAFLAWSGGGWVRMAYVAQNGVWYNPLTAQLSSFATICQGSNPSICLDKDGNLHLAYVNGGMRYRKLQLGSDQSPPSVPVDVLANAQSPVSVRVTWTASTDDMGVAGYKIYRNSSQVGTATITNYTDTGLSPSTTYSYTVSAYDSVGNSSAQSSPPATATTMPPDTQAPSVPMDVQAAVQSATTILVSWTASTDDVGVAGYRIYRNGSQAGISATTSYIDIGLQSTTTYSYTVSALITTATPTIRTATGRRRPRVA